MVRKHRETIDAYHQESFTSPRAMMSLRLFNGFRLLATKCSDAEDLKIYVETLGFRSDSAGLMQVFKTEGVREQRNKGIQRGSGRQGKREMGRRFCGKVGLC